MVATIAATSAKEISPRIEPDLSSMEPAAMVDAAWDVVWKFVHRSSVGEQLMSDVDGIARARAFQSGYDARESLAFFENILDTRVEPGDPDHIKLSVADRAKIERAASIYRAALHWHIGHATVDRGASA